MDRDVMRGKVKVAEGKTLRGIGKVTGNRRMQAKGALRQAEGKIQETVGKGRERMERAADRAYARSTGTKVVRKDSGTRVVRGGTVRVTTTKKTTVKRRR
jgi:uncharacterized protein YjbJ (UPF0337 family)